MTAQEFNESFSKLKSRWPKFFTDEMEMQVYGVCRNLPAGYLSKVFGEAIWNTHPPKIDWFQSIATDFKKWNSEIFPTPNQKIEPMPDSVFTEKDTRMMFQMMRDKLDGRVSVDDWASFTKWVEDKAATSTQGQT